MTDTVVLRFLQELGPRPILLIHGLGSSAGLTWEASGWFRAIEAETRGYIAPDLAGHGASPKPIDREHYSVEALAADIADLLEAQEYTSVDVVGYSLGAQVARALAVTQPDRVRKVVLGGIGEADPLSGWDRDVVEAFLRGDTDDAGNATELLRMMLSQPGATPESVGAMIDGLTGSLPETQLPQESLLVVGERDDIAVGADRLAEQLGSQLHILPRRTHWNAVSARAFKQVALDFLRD